MTLGNTPGTGVVLLHYRHWPDVRTALDAALAQTSRDDVVVVDNASLDGSATAIRAAYPDVQVLERTENRGYGAGMNSGIRALGPRAATLLLTHDCVLTAGCLTTLASALRSDAELGIVGPLIGWRSLPDRVYSAGGELIGQRAVTRHRGWEQPITAWRDTGLLEASWLDGACLLIGSEVLSSVGLFDEDYFQYFEEVELCLRASRAGWRLACETAAMACQEPGAPSYGLWTRNRLRFVARNFSIRAAVTELAASLREIGSRARSKERDDRRVARSMLWGLLALPLRIDPIRLGKGGAPRLPRTSERRRSA